LLRVLRLSGNINVSAKAADTYFTVKAGSALKIPVSIKADGWELILLTKTHKK